MILVGYSWINIAEGVLIVSLVLLLVVIAYKKLLRKLQTTNIDKADFCVLYDLEESPAKGVLPFYFTSEKVKTYDLSIFDLDMNLKVNVAKDECKEGGNIVRYDSVKLPNGEYYYCLKTENQKIVKKMTLLN